MTSKVSNKKFSPVLHNFECGLKSKKKLAAIIAILHFAAAPAIVLALIVSIYMKQPSMDYIETFTLIGMGTTALAGFLGIFFAIDSFSCLHNKSVVDMRLSLPLTADQRFLSNFLSGLTMYVGPFLAAMAVSLLETVYGFIFMEGRKFLAYSGVDQYGEPEYYEYTCEYFSMVLPLLLKLTLCGVLTMLMLYTLTVLVTVCCGSKFESIAYTILINIVIPLTILFSYMSMFRDLYGVSVVGIISKLIMHTSPAGGIAAAIFWTAGTPYIGNKQMEIESYGLWAVIYFLLTAAMGAAAFFLYRKRRAEQVSKPFAFKLIYYIISTAAIFSLYSLFYGSDMDFAPIVIITAIVYLSLEVAANRGYQKIWLSGIRYVGVMAASVLIVFVAQKTEGFGMVTRIPDASRVESVEIVYSDFYCTLNTPYYPSIDYNGMYTDSILIKDRENIDTLIAAHRSLIDNRVNDENAAGFGIRLCYKLKSGRELIRSYDYTSAEAAEIMCAINLSEEYRAQNAEIYKKYILAGKESFLEAAEANPDYEYSKTATLHNSYGSSIGKSEKSSESIRISYLADKGFFEQLAEAYSKDIMSITEENYFKSTVRNDYFIYLHNISLSVPETFSNTMELLEYFGFDIVKIENYSDEDITEYLLRAMTDADVRIFTAEDWRKQNNVPEGVRLHGRYVRRRNYPQEHGRIVLETSTELCELYRGMQPMNIVPENGYIISVFGESGVVPAEMNGIAAKIYAGAVKRGEAVYNNETAFGAQDTYEIPQAEAEQVTTAYTVD